MSNDPVDDGIFKIRDGSNKSERVIQVRASTTGHFRRITETNERDEPVKITFIKV